MSRGGMSGGTWDRTQGNRGGSSQDRMSQQSRGKQGQDDNGRMKSPRKDGAKGQQQRKTSERSSGDSTQRAQRAGDKGRANRNSATGSGEQEMNQHREKVQLKPARQERERNN